MIESASRPVRVSARGRRRGRDSRHRGALHLLHLAGRLRGPRRRASTSRDFAASIRRRCTPHAKRCADMRPAQRRQGRSRRSFRPASARAPWGFVAGRARRRERGRHRLGRPSRPGGPGVASSGGSPAAASPEGVDRCHTSAKPAASANKAIRSSPPIPGAPSPPPSATPRRCWRGRWPGSRRPPRTSTTAIATLR